MTQLSNAPTLARRDGRVAWLRQMTIIREAEQAVLRLRREEQIAGSVHTCIGQESVPVAVIAATSDHDRVLATYRGHGWALACGVPLNEFFGEVLQRSGGTNGGRAGSPYFSAPQHRFIGENSIVGAGLPIANGVAMALKARGDGGVAVVSFGDGATNQGAAHEALVFAIARRLPVLFVCENNAWSEMTPITATVPVPLWQRAAGYGLRAEAVEGDDVALVHQRAIELLDHCRGGHGPAFLEVRVPRLNGHYNADIEHYRTEEDRRAAQERDPMTALRWALLTEGLLSQQEIDELDREAREQVAAAIDEALAMPVPDPATAREHVTATAPMPFEVSPSSSEAKPLKYGLAVNKALDELLSGHEEVVTFGEDIAIPGGSFGVTRNLHKRYGDARVFDTPISESAILGAALGASLEGLKPIVEIMWTDFAFVALDQLVNQAANVRYLSQGKVCAPMVVRMQQGITPGSCAQHSQSMEAVFAHVPGLKVGMPSTPHDAYAMLKAAQHDPDPVVLIESRSLYMDSGPVDLNAPLEPVGGARLRRPGSDIGIITWGRMTNTVLSAADDLAALHVNAAVLDLRWMSPLDMAAIGQLVADCRGKILIVHEANLTGGFGAEIAARLADEYFHNLQGPVRRLGLPDVRVPSSPTLQRALLPQVEDVVAAAMKLAAE